LVQGVIDGLMVSYFTCIGDESNNDFDFHKDNGHFPNIPTSSPPFIDMPLHFVHANIRQKLAQALQLPFVQRGDTSRSLTRRHNQYLGKKREHDN